jgi:hypothetical protein
MSAAVSLQTGVDQTEIPDIVRGSVKLGILESVLILIIGLISKFLDGPVELILLSILVTVAILLVTILPGLWTKATTIEGIAGAAGIGLAATWVFLVFDVTIFQNIGLYSNRWLEIGGGSNWWYHPVFWMVGCFLPWLGAWQLAAHKVSGGQPSPVKVAVISLVFTAICGVAAVLLHIPHAGWNLGTFGVAYLPGLTLATLVTVLGARKQ